MEDKPKSYYMDMPRWVDPLKPDDFVIAIGKKQSNSVYHVESVRKGREKNRMIRYYYKAYKTDLITALRRDPDQKLIPVVWYSRNKKN